MWLTSLFFQGNQPYMDKKKETSSKAMEQNLRNGMAEIAKKSPGQSVTGEVVDRIGNDVVISIGKDQLIRAKLDGKMLVDLGQQMTFTIKNAGSARVVLSPLYANTGNDPNISRALQMAGIPENAASVKMVQMMMKEGMSINVDSLSQMMRAVNMNPNADVETIVQLSRLGLPLTENNLFQMEAYKNSRHQITEGLFEIADAFTETFSKMAAAGDLQGGMELYGELFSLLTEQTDAGLQEAGAAADLEKSAQGAKTVFKDAALFAGLEEQQPGQGAVPDAVETGLTEKELMSFARQLKGAGLPDNLVQSFAEGKLSVEGLLNGLNDLFSGTVPEEQRSGIGRLLLGKEMNVLLKNEISKKWLLAPEEVAKEGRVEKLYERLNSQINRLSQALESAGRADTSLGRAVSNLSGNLDFMNQMNHMFTYVQLPLKLQGQETSGELYVYTNKKNLARKEGEVSALLHLDMEHLGSVDVHVTMKDSNVSTNFYLQDDSALDFIASHIDMLNERLNKKGYSMKAAFLKRGEEENEDGRGNGNVMEEILKQDKNISVLSGYSFDARA